MCWGCTVWRTECSGDTLEQCSSSGSTGDLRKFQRGTFYEGMSLTGQGNGFKLKGDGF